MFIYKNEHFTKTGSGQSSEKVEKKGGVFKLRRDNQAVGPSRPLNQLSGEKTALLLSTFHPKMPSFHQDRLGTIIGKALKKRA
jgi:hypothetical protein